MAWLRFEGALIVGLALSAQAQVTISDHVIQFGSFSSQLRQMSYKAYVFDVGNNEDLNNFRSPSGSRLRGQKGIGRLLLISTCSAVCDNMNRKLSQVVWVNESTDPSGNNWKQAASVDRFGLTLSPAMFENPHLEFAVNGSLVHGTGAEMRIGNSGISHYYIQVFERNDPCRKYKPVYGSDSGPDDEDSDFVSIDLPWSRRLPQTANGIVVGAPKVYDTYALMALRN